MKNKIVELPPSPKKTLYKIESNIPLPLTVKGGIQDFLLKMKNGDSFEYPESDKNKISATANYLKGRYADTFNYKIRKFSTSTYRLWRIPVTPLFKIKSI